MTVRFSVVALLGSKSLRRLEQEPRTKLVARTAKGVELTAVGSVLAAHVQRLQLSFEDVAREADELSEGRAGRLLIGSGPAHADLLPAAYAVLQKEAPDATFSVTASDNDMIPALLKGELDLIVNYFPDAPLPGCDIDPLPGDHDIVVYAAASHPLVKKRTRTLADLADQGWGAVADQCAAVALAAPSISEEWPSAAARGFRDALGASTVAGRRGDAAPRISCGTSCPTSCFAISLEGAATQGCDLASANWHNSAQGRLCVPGGTALHRDPQIDSKTRVGESQPPDLYNASSTGAE